MIDCKLTQLHERLNHEDANFDGARRIEDGGGHEGAVFGESIWRRGGMLEFVEPVTICDQFRFFIFGQREHERIWEPRKIAFHGLI